MVHFQLKEHEVRNCQVVEIFDGDRLLGVIYPQEWGIKIVSKFLTGRGNQVAIDPTIPVALEVRLP